MSTPSAPVQAALTFFAEEHDPAEAPFATQGDNSSGLLIYVPGGLPALNMQTVLQAVHAALEHPDRVSEFLHDLGERL